MLLFATTLAACGAAAEAPTGPPNATPFRALGAGTNGTVTGLGLAGTTLYVGGRFDRAGTSLALHVARWDGATWSGLGAGVDGEVATLSLDPQGGPHVATNLPNLKVHHFDGAGWPTLGDGPPDAQNVFQLMFDDAGALYAPGRYAAPRLPSRIARWDGTTWADFGPSEPPPSGRAALAMAMGPGGALYASFDDNVAQQGRVVRWDGATWQPLGGDFNGSVRTLHFSADDTLYVGGAFTRAGSTPASGVARWDGTTWQGVGNLTIEADLFGVTSLAFGPDGSLYAGGDITAAEGVQTRGLARWDGARWVGAPGGPYGRVWSLVIGADGEVYAGGEFNVVRYFDETRPDLEVNNLVIWRPQG
jgi:hypothetical protein